MISEYLNSITLVDGLVTAVAFQAIQSADLPLATTSAPGAVQPDGTTIVISNGVITAIGGGGGGGSGSVTDVSIVSANGVSGSVANASTTPAITLTLGAITPSTVNGITLSGSGSLANSGTSSLTGFTGSGSSSGTNTGDQTLSGLGGASSSTTLTINGTTYSLAANRTWSVGTVTSVAFAGDGTIFSSTAGTAVTSSGDVSPTLLTQTAHYALMGPTSGSAAAPTFRALVAGDVPTLNQSTTGQAGTVATINGLITAGTNVTLTGNGTSASPYSIAASGGGGGTAYDRFSTLQSAEITINTTGQTLTANRMHVIKDLSSPASYTVSLPSAGTAGQWIGVRIDPAATELYTVDAGAGVVIDGVSTTLTTTITSSSSSIVVGSVAEMPTNGNFTIQIGSELITVTYSSGTTLTVVNRGVGGTSAASHTSGVAVDHFRSRIFWAGESVELMSDGSNWHRVTNNAAPMEGVARLTQNAQSVSSGTWTKINLDTFIRATAAMNNVSSGNNIAIVRPGLYLLSVFHYTSTTAPSYFGAFANATSNGGINNGAGIAGNISSAVTGGPWFQRLNLGIGDVVNAAVYLVGATGTVSSSSGTQAEVAALEIPE